MNNTRTKENLQDGSMRKAFGKDVNISNRELYKWSEPGEMGEFRMIDKKDLFIDLKYQRETTSKNRVLEIARNFNWTIHGALIVSESEDGSLWVIEGGHRLRAALLRDDIQYIPCLVFSISKVSEEAAAFYNMNNATRKNVTPFERHKAGIAAKDPLALMVEDTITKHGYSFAKNKAGSFQTVAVSTVYRIVEKNANLADYVIGFLSKIAQGEEIGKAEYDAIYYIASYNHKADLDDFAIKKLAPLGISGMLSIMKMERIRVGRGGPAIDARAIANFLNKGQSKTKIFVP